MNGHVHVVVVIGGRNFQAAHGIGEGQGTFAVVNGDLVARIIDMAVAVIGILILVDGQRDRRRQDRSPGQGQLGLSVNDIGQIILALHMVRGVIGLTEVVAQVVVGEHDLILADRSLVATIEDTQVSDLTDAAQHGLHRNNILGDKVRNDSTEQVDGITLEEADIRRLGSIFVDSVRHVPTAVEEVGSVLQEDSGGHELIIVHVAAEGLFDSPKVRRPFAHHVVNAVACQLLVEMDNRLEVFTKGIGLVQTVIGLSHCFYLRIIFS